MERPTSTLTTTQAKKTCPSKPLPAASFAEVSVVRGVPARQKTNRIKAESQARDKSKLRTTGNKEKQTKKTGKANDHRCFGRNLKLRRTHTHRAPRSRTTIYPAAVSNLRCCFHYSSTARALAWFPAFSSVFSPRGRVLPPSALCSRSLVRSVGTERKKKSPFFRSSCKSHHTLRRPMFSRCGCRNTN